MCRVDDTRRHHVKHDMPPGHFFDLAESFARFRTSSKLRQVKGALLAPEPFCLSARESGSVGKCWRGLRGKAGASVRIGPQQGPKRRQEGHFSPETGSVGTDGSGFRRTAGAVLPTLPHSRARRTPGYRRSRFPARPAPPHGSPSCRGGRISVSPHFGTKSPVPFVPGRCPRARGARS